MCENDFRVLLDAYLSALDGDASRYATKQTTLVLPEPNPDLFRLLFRQAQTLFQSDPVLLDISSPCIIVGDIHGQILDLLRILLTFGIPGPIRYLFLGDLVDRGEFSLEALVIPLLLKVIWPDHVFILRGNHEFRQLCSQSGFLKEMIDIFGNSLLYDEAIRVFREMPFAARVDGSMLCVHGGIGPGLMAAEHILFIQRPIDEFGDENVDALVWSDPSEDITMFEPSAARGAGFRFGCLGLVNFLDRSNLNLLVRAHECVADGYEYHFGSRCITIFSASNYCMSGNRGAVLEVTSAQCFRARDFPALTWLSRKDVVFKMCGKSSVLRSRRSIGMCPKLSSTSGSGLSLFIQKKGHSVPSAMSVSLPPLDRQEFEEEFRGIPIGFSPPIRRARRSSIA
jgi:protein phosphatase